MIRDDREMTIAVLERPAVIASESGSDSAVKASVLVTVKAAMNTG